MSINYQTYVGPYVRCVVGTKEAQRLHVTCPNAGCVNYGTDVRTPFCDRCGAKIASLPETYIDDAVDQGDLRDAIGERLINPSGDGYYFWRQVQHIHLWVPNISMPGRDPRLEEREDFALVEITPALIEEERAQFEAFFAAELAAFRKAYGEAAVTIHWGVIQDYS